MTLGYVLARAASTSRTLSVLDWGGGLGHHYALAQRLLPDTEFDWHIRELPAVCREGKQTSPLVTFHEDDDCLEGHYELVLASSSFQYAEGWQSLLHGLAEATTDFLLLTRLPVVERAPSFVVLQRAHAYGYATEYLGWVFNRGELFTATMAAGLDLERQFLLQEPLEIPGAPEHPSDAAFLFLPTRR
jgi:putative methyltransferase (TIGR04325 family)